MKYKLKSGLASYEGEVMGVEEWWLPIKKTELEKALKEALRELAAQKNDILAEIEGVESMGELSKLLRQHGR